MSNEFADVEFDLAGLGEGLYSIEDGSDGIVGSATDLVGLEMSVTPLQDLSEFSYPAVLLTNVYFADALKVLNMVRRDKSYRSVPVWVESSDVKGYANIGDIQLDSTFLVTASYVGVGVTLYASEDKIVALDLSDPNTIAEYI